MGVGRKEGEKKGLREETEGIMERKLRADWIMF